jgi:hypothetical protein
MAGLLDFFQGASNAAASNVSAPVDGLAWLLKQAGVDVGTPMGGSDWMRQKGLTKEPQNKFAGLLGESVGGLTPIIAAAKAPQIAKGLLQGAENLAAPRTMNPQTGAIVWHGSPHKFNQFDSAKIGTGEGAQAYGHGLYFAESPDVAKSYQAGLSSPKYISGGKELKGNDAWAAQFLHDYQGNALPKKVDLNTAMEKARKVWTTGEVPPELVKSIKNLDSAGVSVENGALYKVDLPDEHIAKMLDWDNGGRDMYADAARKIENYKTLALNRDELLSKYPADTMSNSVKKMTGEDRQKFSDLANKINEGAKNKYASASDYFREQGIPGIRYLDEGSRGAGAGSSNYVIFPGNESLLSILERNGQALK